MKNIENKIVEEGRKRKTSLEMFLGLLYFIYAHTKKKDSKQLIRNINHYVK